MPNIVVAEDEPVLCQLISEELTKNGFTVTQTENGREAWEVIQQVRPDLILLDLLMPIMSGYDVLTELRAHPELKETLCIVISNSGQIDDLNRAFACGADDVLIKADFNPDQLVAKVRELLSRRQVG